MFLLGLCDVEQCVVDLFSSMTFVPYLYTLPETNIAPANEPSQKESSLPNNFQRRAVSFREGNSFITYFFLLMVVICHETLASKADPSKFHNI